MLELVCRGTQTLQNVITDIKAWLAPLQPERRHNGHTCKARLARTDVPQTCMHLHLHWPCLHSNNPS